MPLDRVRRNVARMIKRSRNLIQKKHESNGTEGFDTRSIPIFVHYWQKVDGSRTGTGATFLSASRC